MPNKTLKIASLLLAVAPGVLFGQGTVTTIVGATASGFRDGISATEARLLGVQAIAIDPARNAYISDSSAVRRVDAATGLISTLPESGLGGLFLAIDPSGDLVLLAKGVLSRLEPNTGTITELGAPAGSPPPNLGFFGGIAVDSSGNVYVTDFDDGKIYEINAATNAVTRIAGIGGGGGAGTPDGDGGPATQAALGRPAAITVDSAGNIFFAEQDWLRRIDGKTGIITTIAPNSSYLIGSNLPPTPVSQAVFDNITSLSTDAAGNLYVADGPRVRKIDWIKDTVYTVAGSGSHAAYSGDGVPAVQANLMGALAIQIDAGGNLWIGDNGNDRLFVVPASTGLIRTVAGTSTNGDGGPAIGAVLSYPTSLAVNPQGDIYIGAGSVRRVDHASGNISTVVPQPGELGESGTSVALDSSGALFFATNFTVQRVDAISGAITTVAGQINAQSLGDGGPATAATVSPSGLAIDAKGNLFIADYWNYRVRRVDANTGIITTFAGNGTSQYYSGATGGATNISIGVPNFIAFSPSGVLYVSVPQRVLKIDPAGNLLVAAGNGGCGYAGDGGSATAAPVCQPLGLAFDTDGSLFISENTCGCVRRVAADTGIIQTVAGTGTPGTSGDDPTPALSTALSPLALAFSTQGLLLTDAASGQTSGRLRAVANPEPPPLPQAPRITGITNAIDFNQTFSPGAIVAVMGNYLSAPTPFSEVIGSDGRVTASLGGNQVSFNGLPGPILYASPGQINTVIPFSLLPGSAAVEMQNASGTDSQNIALTATSLALPNGLVFNPDNTINSATNPAPKGATLVMYGTGMGQTTPPGIDGSIVQGPPFPTPNATFSASVQNGITATPANIAYLGPLPGFVDGATQVNVQIPETVPPGKSTLIFTSSIGYVQAVPQTIYMLSDQPVLTGFSAAPPFSQTVGSGNSFTLLGTGLVGIVGITYYLNGQVFQSSQGAIPCTLTSCMVGANFAGKSGDFSVEVVNAANQVSNQLAFSVLPPPPPAVTSVVAYPASNPPVATKDPQFVNIIGTNFEEPTSVDIFYNGNKIATLSPSSTFPPMVYNPNLIQIDFNFQGNAGNYGIEVVRQVDNSTSAIFNFTVAAP